MARAAFGILGWTPETFWSATPADLRLALEGRFPHAAWTAETVPLSRDDLAALMRRFPDKQG